MILVIQVEMTNDDDLEKIKMELVSAVEGTIEDKGYEEDDYDVSWDVE